MGLRTNLVAFTGYMGSGKTTAAGVLEAKGFKIVPLAEPLKRVAYSMGWNGRKDALGRKLLQRLGTECGRECIGMDCWIDMWEDAHAAQLQDGVTKLVIDDLRFENEARMVRRLGGRVIRIERESAQPNKWAKLAYQLGVKSALHPSERPIPSDLVSVVVDNDDTVADLARKIHQVTECVTTTISDSMPMSGYIDDLWIAKSDCNVVRVCTKNYDLLKNPPGTELVDMTNVWMPIQDVRDMVRSRGGAL